MLLAWVAAAVATWLFVGPVDPAASESPTYLPDDMPSQRAVERLLHHFPNSVGLSEAVVVFERPGGPLSRADMEAIERVGGLIADANASAVPGLDLAGVTVRTPGSIPLPGNPLVSPVSQQGQAALIVVNVPANFITTRASRVVHHIRAILQSGGLPDGLQAAVTGSSGYGCDYALATERSSHRTSYVTLAAVLIILIVVYRAPLAALVPLGAVTLAAAIVLKLLDVFSQLGMHAGTAERIFVFVLLYGAGTDYSLLLISRYREFILDAVPPREAAAKALRTTYPAILGSGTTNAIGLLTLCFASFRIFRTTGPAVGTAMCITLLAAGTLIPAMLAILGRAVFWPQRWKPDSAPQQRETSKPAQDGSPFWRRVAAAVTVRPGTVLAGCLLLLCAPAVFGARVSWVYDQLTSLSPSYGAIRGKDMVKRHWSIGQLAPVSVLVEVDSPLDDRRWSQIADALTTALHQTEGVQDVRSLSQPLGRRRAPATQPWSAASGILHWMTDKLVWPAVRAEYVAADGAASRLAVVLRDPALSLEAMQSARRLRQAAEQATRRLAPGARVLLAGATPRMMDLRTVTTRDFRRIAPLALGLIFLIVLALLREPVLCAFMVACTVVSYLATLGISEWVFVGLLDRTGLDWKVQVFLFVVMVAVGVDYSIFLAARLAEEKRRLPYDAAIRRAVVHTGPVISSCGIIMAATLGSLMAGDLKLLHQLGFALALGMLLDTFVIRPLALPAFAALSHRLGRRASG